MTKHRFSFISLLAALSCTSSSAKEDEANPTLVEVRKIWDKAPHNAFTDLVRFKDEWLLCILGGQGTRLFRRSLAGYRLQGR
jgi:hypothetical protein